ncbi:MAG: hypothetical protein BGO67_10265 [Alphaproteobacteria bacterium 41-28]|nr:MAG: hypothetical protein BGO67_10265 [Alphaproteobacteria bacterium 41-28]
MENNQNTDINNFIYDIEWHRSSLTHDIIAVEARRNIAIVIEKHGIDFYYKIIEYINSSYQNIEIICIVIEKEFKRVSNSIYNLNFENENYTKFLLDKKITDIVFFCDGSSEISYLDTDGIIDRISQQTKSLIDLITNFTNTFSPPVTIITKASSSINIRHSVSSLIQSTLWSAANVIKLEFSEVDLKCIDLDNDHETCLPFLMNEILFNRNIDRVAVKEGYKYIPKLKKHEQAIASYKSELEGKTFLITGGTGGIGLTISEWLATNNIENILLVSRFEPNNYVKDRLKDLKKSGVNIRLYHFDISKKSDVDNLFDMIRSEGYIIDNIIHAAGIIKDATFQNVKKESLESVLLPKVAGILNIYNNIKQKNIYIKKIIMFSSSTSLIGNVGQISYAIANAFLDGFTYFLKNEGIDATTINWGMWDKIGMANKVDARTHLEVSGFKGISKLNGIKVLEYLLKNKNILQIAVLPINWKIFLTKYNIGNIEFFDYVSSKDNKVKEIVGDNVSSFANKAHATKIDLNKIESLIKGFVSEALGIDANEITEQSNFSELGMDSLSAVILKNNIQDKMKVNISLMTLYKFINYKDMHDYILNELK